MTRRLTDFAGTAQKLESALSARVEDATRAISGARVRQPLEIVHAIADAVERQIQPSGRGRAAFPFNQIRVVLVAASPQSKAHLEAACEGPPALQTRIEDRLKSAGCAAAPLSVKVAYVARPKPEWQEPDFHVEYARGAAAPAPAPQPIQLELTITHGTAGQSVYTVDASTVTLGRGEEVRDHKQLLVRTNHVAFVEGGGDINHSVSRRHARIEHEPSSNSFRVFDDGSTQGTSVLRRGRGLPVPRGSKGLRLQSGDEIALGQARVRVRIVS
jgi:hypothetical protein